ncbi:MAG: M24 family metallopeptidase, partial [Clostridiaceae bacterium]|nr:M24 family metallopeptidase [Clostridiaceae bacterium]
DFGAVLDGYVSDMTRTVGLGEPDPKLVEIYHIVEEARKRAVAAVSSSATGREVDAAARDYIASKGWADCFTHSTGHGIGLELHELPVVSRLNGEQLPAGAVVTIEPGVYVEGLGGVRIEDDVIVHPDGGEVITGASPTELRVLCPA